MGIQTVRENKAEKKYQLRGISSMLRTKPQLWLIILSFLIISTLITVILNLWFTSLILLVLSVCSAIFSYIYLKVFIKATESEHERLMTIIKKNDEYLSEFSHRIRTPLNNLPLINDVLNEISIKGEQKELLETLISSTNNMISALNELTMKTAGEISIKPRTNIRFDLNNALEGILELYRDDTGVRIDFNIDGQVPKEYLGDPVAVKQIIINLISLLKEKTKDHILEIGFGVRSSGKSGQVEIIEFIFTTNIINSKSEEDILKNSLSARIIQLMNGKYSLNQEGKNLSIAFTISLQRIIEEKKISPVGEKIRKLDTEAKKSKELAEANVLLVEDNITNQKIVKISLGPRVNNIDTAINGKEALDMFGTSNYDIILMDIQLPVMDGITASKKIREIEASTSKHTPIIAITANAMIGDKEKCLSAGMDDYLSKPIQPKTLMDIIKKYLTQAL